MTELHDADVDEVPTAAPRRRRVLVSVAFTLALLAGVYYLWPTALGGCATFTVVTGKSMEPTYSTGDVVFSRCGTPEVGNIVVYASEDTGGARIIHRIIGGDGESGWQLQGDNNSWVDPFEPTQDEVIGIAKLHIPKLGLMADTLANRWMWLSLFAIAGALFLWPSRHKSRDRDEPMVVPAQAIVAAAVADHDPAEIDARVRRYVGVEPEPQPTSTPTPALDPAAAVAAAVADHDPAEIDARVQRHVEHLDDAWAHMADEIDPTTPLTRPIVDPAWPLQGDDDWWTEEIARLVFPDGEPSHGDAGRS
jgi:signal peptidase